MFNIDEFKIKRPNRNFTLLLGKPKSFLMYFYYQKLVIILKGIIIIITFNPLQLSFNVIISMG